MSGTKRKADSQGGQAKKRPCVVQLKPMADIINERRVGERTPTEEMVKARFDADLGQVQTYRAYLKAATLDVTKQSAIEETLDALPRAVPYVSGVEAGSSCLTGVRVGRDKIQSQGFEYGQMGLLQSGTFTTNPATSRGDGMRHLYVRASYTFMPCLRGKKCVYLCYGRFEGMSPEAAAARTPLVSFMTPSEWDRFWATGVSSSQRRPCLLCLRYSIEYIHNANCSYPSVIESVDPEKCKTIQSFAEEGYAPQYLVRPCGDVYTGLLQPIARADFNAMVFRPNPNVIEPCYYLDQSPMALDPPKCSREVSVSSEISAHAKIL